MGRAGFDSANQLNRLAQVIDPTGTYQFTFDYIGRLSGTSTQYAFLTSRTFTTSYSYDAASNRTTFTDPENGSSSYVYDTLNRLQTLTPPAAISGGNFAFGCLQHGEWYDAPPRKGMVHGNLGCCAGTSGNESVAAFPLAALPISFLLAVHPITAPDTTILR